jgi:hypothetical protein
MQSGTSFVVVHCHNLTRFPITQTLTPVIPTEDERRKS